MITGKLRDRIYIKSKQQTKDEFMQVVNANVDVVSIRAEHQPKGGRIRFSQGVQVEQKYDRFIIRYNASIKPDMTLMYLGEEYRVISATPSDNKRRDLIIEAELMSV